ncbi:MAG: CmpX [Parcubacteria bacterium C7867-006]|nr:MAG: CmpX [Parcubacteria bacterium C7867-006]
MVLQTWVDVLKYSFANLWTGIIMFIPKLVVALVILCIGWAVGAAISKAISHFMKMIKFDEALKKAGFEDLTKKAGLELNSGHFLGSLVKYFVIVVFLIASFDVLGLNEVTSFLKGVVVDYLPHVIVAALVLLVGGVVGDIIARIVSASAKSAGLTSAGFVSTVSKWAVWVFAILVALSQMGIAGAFIQTLFTGFVVAVSLALGLSFGLGGQEAAAKTIDKVKQSISHN